MRRLGWLMIVGAAQLAPALLRAQQPPGARRGAPALGRRPAAPPKGPILRVPIDPTQGVNFRAAVDRNFVYVGEQVTYQVGVFLDDETRRRLRRNPEFTPPEPRAMLAYDLASPAGASGVRVQGGRRYEVHVFQRALFPLTPGRALIPPARLSYALPLTNSFFAREERRTARADSIVVNVRPVPDSGKPADYRGAVGRFNAALGVDTTAARVGDPLLLTVRVRGEGNIKLLPRPALELDWAHAVPSGERVVVDSGRMTVSGFKDFTWLVTPRRSGVVSLPAVRYPYFDPQTERYEIGVTGPRELRVRPGALAAVDSSRGGQPAVQPLPLRATFRGEGSPVLPQRPWFWAATFLLPFPALIVGAARRERQTRRRSAAQRLRTLARAPDTQPAVVRQRFTAALADRIWLPPGSLASEVALARALRRAGVTRDTADDAARLLGELDAAAYAEGGGPTAALHTRALAIYVRVDAEARHRLAPPLWQWLFTVATAGAVAAAGLHAGPPAGEAARSFARGVDAYRAGRFAEAADEFAITTRLAPRASDAWANRGTAAWMRQDTAAAAVGWQRAVRIEPTASDVRAHLELLPGEQLRGAAWVPAVPVSVAAALALGLWAAACVAATWRVHRRRTVIAAPTGVLTVAATAWAALAWVADDARTARRLDVVTQSGETRVSPALGADLGPSVHAGEVVRVLARRDAWTRVTLEAGRDGWIETARLAPLAAE